MKENERMELSVQVNDIFTNKVNKEQSIISYNELINEMIADSWYMVSEYKLNLGPADTLGA